MSPGLFRSIPPMPSRRQSPPELVAIGPRQHIPGWQRLVVVPVLRTALLHRGIMNEIGRGEIQAPSQTWAQEMILGVPERCGENIGRSVFAWFAGI